MMSFYTLEDLKWDKVPLNLRETSPICVENAQMVMFPSLIYAHKTGVLNEKRCKISNPMILPQKPRQNKFIPGNDLIFYNERPYYNKNKIIPGNDLYFYNDYSYYNKNNL